MPPPHDFLVLASTLLSQLAPGVAVPDTLLLQLHAIFGPTLLSALQLVDRREVVRVNLPGGRHIYQVTSSSGAPYTLYLDLPWKDGGNTRDAEKTILQPPADGAANDQLGPTDQTTLEETHTTSENKAAPPHTQPKAKRSTHSAADDAHNLATMYCPCAGFAYNSLAAERVVMCKHILAVLMAGRMGKVVETDVPIAATAGLLGLSGGGG